MSNKKIFCLILFFLFCSIIRAQIFTNIFLADKVIDKRIISDENGFIYLVGYDPKYYLPSYNDVGENHLVIRKYEPSGKLLWENTIISPEYLRFTGVNYFNKQLFIGGGFRNQLCYDNSCTFSQGGEDLFLSVVSEEGNITIKTEGATGDEEVFGFTMDNSGNCYFTGRGTGVVTLGSKTHTVQLGKDPFLLKKSSDFKEIQTLFGSTTKPDEYLWGTARLPQFHNDKLYCWFNGWHTMEGSNDTLGLGTYAQLYRVDDDLTNYTSIDPVFSAIFNSHDLEFVDANDNYYFSSKYYGKNSSTTLIQKANKEFKTVWSYSVDPYYQMSHMVKKADSYYFASTIKDKTTGEFLLCIMRGECDEPVIYPLNQIHLGFSPTYMAAPGLQEYGAHLLLSGEFNGYLRIEDTLLYTADNKMFIATVQFDRLTSVKQYHQTTARIYPNPVRGTLHFDLPEKLQDAQVFIYNSQGQIIRTLSANGTSPTSVDLSGYEAGVYFVSVGSKDHINRFKIVVQ
jgi:hypothetical protein